MHEWIIIEVGGAINAFINAVTMIQHQKARGWGGGGWGQNAGVEKSDH